MKSSIYEKTKGKRKNVCPYTQLQIIQILASIKKSIYRIGKDICINASKQSEKKQ